MAPTIVPIKVGTRLNSPEERVIPITIATIRIVMSKYIEG